MGQIINIYKEQTLCFFPWNEHNLDCEVRLAIRDDKNSSFSHLVELKPKDIYQLSLSELESHMQYRYKYQVKENDIWVDKIKYKPLTPEQQTEEGIKYLLYPNRKSSHLIVIFQAVNKNPGYNYIRTLKDTNISKLFIKDDYGTDETRSSYYLGPNKSFIIADNTLKLIEKVRKDLSIEKSNTICAGSSKGGFSSIYFGYRGSYGHIIAGGPQILLGNYLSKGRIDETDENSSDSHPILKYLTKEITQENIQWANNILFNIINQRHDHDPNLFLHVGKGEPHYENHALPFKKFMNEKGKINVNFDLGDYNKHSELATHFPIFLQDTTKRIINSLN